MRLLNQGHVFSNVPELSEAQFTLLQRWCVRAKEKSISTGISHIDWFTARGAEGQSAAKLFEYGLLASYRSVSRTRRYQTLKKGKMIELPGVPFVTIYYRPLDWVVEMINKGPAWFPLVKGVPHEALPEAPKQAKLRLTVGSSAGATTTDAIVGKG